VTFAIKIDQFVTPGDYSVIFGGSDKACGSPPLGLLLPKPDIASTFTVLTPPAKDNSTPVVLAAVLGSLAFLLAIVGVVLFWRYCWRKVTSTEGVETDAEQSLDKQDQDKEEYLIRKPLVKRQ